jgi:hypothetical protein
MQLKISNKHLQIDRAQSVIIGAIAAATIITAFSLVSSKALLSQAAFQRRVLNERTKASVQLDKNIDTAKKIVDQYNNVFQGDNPTNIIGGRNTTDKDVRPPDGDNARIVLDALPSTYDFPALLTSVDLILQTNHITNPAIGGTDNTSQIDNKPVTNPQPQAIALTIDGTANIANAKKLILDFEHSIRPFDITKFSIGGNESSLSLALELNTYFQPAKALTTGTKEIK